MTDPVNLDNLREMTGGDSELEKELFGVYLSSSEACLTALKANTQEGQEELWRTQAHAWKGMSLNLGADMLGTICADAQANHLAPAEKKAEMLTAMEAEYARVKAYLTTV